MFTLSHAEANKMISSTDNENSMESSIKSIMAKADAEMNSISIIGFPLQASSPSSVEAEMRPTSGDGDGHSIRSVHNLFSPIHSLKSRNSVNCAMIETPPSSSLNQVTTPVTPDSFLQNFDKGSTSKNHSSPYSLEQELLLSEKVSKMDDSEAKKLLTKVLIDNMGLRQELRTKEKRIAAYKGQMLAILDWKVRQACEGESNDSSSQQTTNNHSNVQVQNEPKGETENDSEVNMIPQKTIHSSREITMVEEVYGIRRSLSFMQDIASSIDVDHEILKDRLRNGYYLTYQLLVGGLAGWMSALFVKKFGKVALSATGGGLILLVYTARKGFVNVNYESIYQEISKFCDNAEETCSNSEESVTSNDSDSDEADENIKNCSFTKSRENLHAGGMDPSKLNDLQQICAYDKLRHAKNWITAHTYSVGGFVLTFVYNLI